MLAEAIELSQCCNCFLALGSSLLVNPAASLAGLAKRHGATLIVITLGETPYDAMADITIHAKVGAVLPRILDLGSKPL